MEEGTSALRRRFERKLHTSFKTQVRGRLMARRNKFALQAAAEAGAVAVAAPPPPLSLCCFCRPAKSSLGHFHLPSCRLTHC